MGKVWTILQSEYWRRVRSKTFVLTTLLAPFILILIFLGPAALGHFAAQTSTYEVAVVDESGEFSAALAEVGGAQFQFAPFEGSVDSARQAVQEERYDGYLLLPDNLLEGDGRATYYTREGSRLSERAQLEQHITNVVEERRLALEDTPAEVLSIIESDIGFATRMLTEEGDEADSAVLGFAVASILAFLMYFAVFFYGQYVMQGVIEEKTSRVVEIVVSSVRPFELLMGKVLGIGAMGLTQMLIWGVIILGGLTGAGSIVALFVDPATLDLPDGATQEAMLDAAGITIPTIPTSLIVAFVLFFLAGYLLYASLFAAAASAVDQQQDAQNLVFPVMMLLIIPLILTFFIIEAPDTTLSVIASFVPFFSPILMPVRMAVAEVPLWEVGLAFVLLVGTFLVTMWLSARIYRVGILMYGKTPSLREIARWAVYQ